ncbi:DNA/RNA non-specific endonuclease [Nostoc sp. CHAB 5834]|nr:DNA/RNA non-specific endonuclease [Nostoc sp. CHAB 5834]
MHKFVAAAVLLFSATLANAGDFNACKTLFPGGAEPVVSKASPGQQRALCFDSFAVLHSGASKTAVYAVERLNRAVLLDAKDETRTDKFYEEARLPEAHRAKLSDYKAGSKVYDRGHLFPAADAPNQNAMAHSFSLANMVPQARENNRGVWAKAVEKAVRHYVMRAGGDVYVFTGPHFEGAPKTLGSGKVWIPSHLYKLVYDAKNGRSWAYWVENSGDVTKPTLISYSELVQRTGIHFLPAVDVNRNSD